jgi:glycosyltransferase involved in cell wall biosynthesis
MNVSIAMAVRNGASFIRDQLDSFVRQRRLPDELVVSDNSSSDSTVDIVREFATHAPFSVRLVVNERNLGVNKNFERAIHECSGEVIFLSDCDDVWYSDKISTMLMALENCPRAGLAVCDADLVDHTLKPLNQRAWKTYRQAPPRLLLRKMADGVAFRGYAPAGGCCMAFRAEFKPLVLPIPSNHSFRQIGHDSFIALCVVCSGAAGIVFVPHPLLAYRQHPKQMTRLPVPRWALLRARPLELRALVNRLESDTAIRYCKNLSMRTSALHHWRNRLCLPTARIARIPMLVRELVSGRYHHYSRGFSTAIKDAFFVV